ncbi:MAG: phosphate ABC transporter permease subunit PstC [Deltaproteobacteria bacterium]|nr:MAG: phosphate ABC transporter permease subunit PstC [Deltaproteobacteria bacterium]
MHWILTATLAALTAVGFALGRRRALALASGAAGRLHSRPSYHGTFVALAALLPAAALLLVFFVSGRRTVASFEFVSALALATGGLAWARSRIHVGLRARPMIERALGALLLLCAIVSVLTTAGIVLSLIFEALRFFQLVPFTEFLFGLRWSPQTAIRADQVGSSGSFGAVPVFAGTLLITGIAMLVAVPVGLLSAIYLSDYAGLRTRSVVKPLLEILAGIPTVVYGFFAALTVGPWVRVFAERLGLDVASESALAAGVVMGLMIIPFVSSLSDDVIRAVPQSLREGSLGLGATPSETIRRVVLPAALPGIVGAVLLAVSRAIGETMIVVMAAGLAANLTANPFEAVTTVTVQIVTLLVGDQEFDSAKTLAAFALGLALFVATLGLNVIALSVVRRYREQYE